MVWRWKKGRAMLIPIGDFVIIFSGTQQVVLLYQYDLFIINCHPLYRDRSERQQTILKDQRN